MNQGSPIITLTASSARKLSETSVQTLQKTCDYITAEITKQAELGKNCIILEYLSDSQISALFKPTDIYSKRLDPRAGIITTSLTNAGFSVRFEGVPVTVGGGFGSDAEPETKNIEKMVVRW